MSSQDASPFFDASIRQSRRQSNVPTPNLQSPCVNNLGSLVGKKRKRDGNSPEDLLKDTFVVKPYPSKVNARPRTLQPIILLPRLHLPLSYLDVGSTTNPLPQSRLFETHVKILELEERMGNQPMVLIARLDDNRTLYAVERESRGLYVVLQLGSWINIQQLKSSAVVAQTDRADLPVKGLLLGSTAIEPLTAPLITGSKYNKKKRLAIEAIQSMIKRPSTPSTPLLPEPRPQSAAPESVPVLEAQNETQATVTLPAIETTIQATATEIFDNIRTQYFESLYLSKTSLAYFAKGPLSRARAAFHLDFDANLDMNELIAFLESLILSSTLLDKKYRDGVPACVSALDIHDQSADDVTVKPKRRKANKKMKPGKNGLYPNEESLIGKWWLGHDEEVESGAPGSSKDDLARTRIANLRIRETQLQMIVILEIFALQPLVSTTGNLEEGLPSLPSNDIIQIKERTPKTRKQDHLTMLIDVHIDRLCIWQSIASEAIKAPDTGSGPTAANTVKHTDNILKDFCIEVIIPFFSARLPDRCDAINRKLGGPITKSASKPRVSKSSSLSNTPTRPGAVTKRPVPAKQRKSLQRVLTDDRERRSMSIGSNRAISLMRSATDPTIPGLKREASEAPPLSNIPSAEFKPLHVSRGGVLNSKRFSQREVDMSTLAPDLNSKAKKQAAIDAELKDAISALKKPNRELAGKTLAETAERRSALAGHPRKSKKPVRNPLFQGFQSVQIKATPKTSRQKDVFGESQSTVGGSRNSEDMELGVIPPSSVSAIPQSTVRHSYDRDPFRDSIQATPSRISFSSFPRSTKNFKDRDTDYGTIPPSSPLQMRRSSAQLFNSVPDSVVRRRSVSAIPRGILETPIKKPSPSTFFNGIEETPLKQISLKETPLKEISFKETPLKETPLKETPIKGTTLKETPLGKLGVWKFGHSHPSDPSNQDQENIRDVPVALGKMKPIQIYKKEVSYYEALGWNDDDIDDLA